MTREIKERTTKNRSIIADETVPNYKSMKKLLLNKY
jgi:hypothetical protein